MKQVIVIPLDDFMESILNDVQDPPAFVLRLRHEGDFYYAALTRCIPVVARIPEERQKETHLYREAGNVPVKIINCQAGTNIF
jgi:hypothetical protein